MTATVQQAAVRMTEDLVSWLPVTGPTGLVGVVSAGDMVRRPASQGKLMSQCSVADIMTLGVICCRQSEPAMAALQLMNRHLIYELGVLDATDRLAGVVTAHDLMGAMLKPDSTEE